MAYKILIVDDEVLMVEILSRFLGPVASQIDSTDDLRTAVDLAHCERFQLIILDLKLIHTGKREALASIRSLKENGSAVIVVSGLPEPGLRDECLAAGADEFLEKNTNLTSQAMLLTAHVVSLKLPRNMQDDDFLERIQVMEEMAGISKHA